MFNNKQHIAKSLFLLLGIIFFKIGYNQIDNSKFGFTINPIVPVNYFGAGPLTIKNDTANLTLSSKIGYQFGMLWRTDFSDHFSLESGILFTRRNFKIRGNSSITGTNTRDSTSFGYINYNLPLKGFVYIQLSEKTHISSSAGISIDFYASDVSTMGKGGLIAHYSERARWINASLISGLGFEWRDDNKGIFYVGAGVNIPVSTIAVTYLWYNYNLTLNGTNYETKFSPEFIKGNYLSLDLKYFLPVAKK
jgi:hypothetical protein